MTPTTVAVIIIACCAMICITLIIVARMIFKAHITFVKGLDKDFEDLESFRHHLYRNPRPPGK